MDSHFTTVFKLGRAVPLPCLAQSWKLMLAFLVACHASSVRPSVCSRSSEMTSKRTSRVNIFSLFHSYLPLEKSVGLHLKKLESTSLRDALCQVWLKLALWFWRRFINFVNVFSLYRNYFPLEKGMAHRLNKLESPIPKDALCHVSLKLTQCRRTTGNQKISSFQAKVS